MTFSNLSYGQNTIKDSIVVNDQVRLFKYTQSENVKDTAKIIIVLHGSGMNMDFMEEVVGDQFRRLAHEHGNSIIVYPDGFKGNWNDCRASATYPAKKQKIDDVAFIIKIIERLEGKYSISNTEAFAVGYSNGGHMCFKLAKQLPEIFKGYATVGANLPVSVNDDCMSSLEAVSMLLINGTEDPINPYNGGEVIAGDGQIRGNVLSAEQTLDYWLSLLGGESKVETRTEYEDIVPQDDSYAIQQIYGSALSTRKVSFLRIINGGHHFANPGFQRWPEYLGNLNQDVNLPEIIMNFFLSL